MVCYAGCSYLETVISIRLSYILAVLSLIVFILLAALCFLWLFHLRLCHCIPVAIVLVTVCMPSCIYIFVFAQFLYMPDDAQGAKHCINVCRLF